MGAPAADRTARRSAADALRDGGRSSPVAPAASGARSRPRWAGGRRRHGDVGDARGRRRGCGAAPRRAARDMACGGAMCAIDRRWPRCSEIKEAGDRRAGQQRHHRDAHLMLLADDAWDTCSPPTSLALFALAPRCAVRSRSWGHRQRDLACALAGKAGAANSPPKGGPQHDALARARGRARHHRERRMPRSRRNAHVRRSAGACARRCRPGRSADRAPREIADAVLSRSGARPILRERCSPSTAGW